MNIRYFLLCSLLFCFLQLSAQNIFTGTVLDTKKQPIPGVRVEVVGRTAYTTTDIDGRFRLDLPGKVRRLRFIYVGWETTECQAKQDMVVKMRKGQPGREEDFRLKLIQVGGDPASTGFGYF